MVAFLLTVSSFLSREKQIPLVAMEMTDLPISKEWQTVGRMCLPRLLFVFQKNDLPTEELIGSRVDGKQIRGKVKKLNTVQKVQQNLEDQIFRILRKSRVLTNNLNHCLFSVPANQAFVFIASGSEPEQTPMDVLTSSFRSDLKTEDFDEGLLELGVPDNPTIPVFIDSLPTLTTNRESHSFKSFLQQHIDIILNGKGFEDSLVRGTSAAHFEFPTLRNWIKVADMMYELYMYPPEESKLYEEFESLQTVLDVDMRFSEGYILVCSVRLYSILFKSIPFSHSILLCLTLSCSIRLCSTLSSSTPFWPTISRSTLLCSIPFHFILFYSVLFCSTLSILFDSTQFCSTVSYSVLL
ncbi:hypothetical protein BSL78_27510 [Apostichopus japonicus]|uniref:Nonsense-mediated mRNA decay factor SMG8 n=1 Tax=Stichopus japonicus TaxID=307972 RepID=A0A2G8JIV0_STIJA|nr:hypothetical protein BSL78_27510 [Apostichopus japonicus]